MCYNVRKKEQEELLRQAKLLQKQKMEREYISNRLKSHSLNKKSSMSALTIKSNIINTKNSIKSKTMNNRNKKNEQISLPVISNGTKNEEGSIINNDSKVNDGKSLDNINDMMEQIIEEN